MSDSPLIETIRTWAGSRSVEHIADYYLFGSLIYQDGTQFDHDIYGSDVDIVVKFDSDGLSPAQRQAACIGLFKSKLELEVTLLQSLRAKNPSKPIASIVPVTPFEIACDIHKSTTTGFFSCNDFLSLTLGTIAPFTREYDFSSTKKCKSLVAAIQKCQEWRNKFLGISANKTYLINAYNDKSEAFPKDLARTSGGVSHYLKPRLGKSETDVNEGTIFLIKLVDERCEADPASWWNQLRDIISQRVGRGSASLAAEDILLLYELLAYRSETELRSFIKNKELVEKGNEKNFGINATQISIQGSNEENKIAVMISLPQRDISSRQIHEILVATEGLLAAMGFNKAKEKKPEIGSFGQEMLFVSLVPAVKTVFEMVSWLVRERVEERGRDRGREVGDLARAMQDSKMTSQRPLVTQEIGEASDRLVKSLDEVEEAVIRVGPLVIIKIEREGHGEVFVRHLSKEAIAALETRPELLKEPNKLLDILQKEQQ